MKHPAYHLRPNKAVDRLVLLESLRLMAKLWDCGGYTYYSLGGPTLEDFRLVSAHFPEMRLVSIEEEHETYKRQKFHKCAKNLSLVHDGLGSFLSTFPVGQKSVFWLDYTRLEYDCFDQFMQVLQLVGDQSIVKITLRATWDDWRLGNLEGILGDKLIEVLRRDAVKDFRHEFEKVLPALVTSDQLERPTLFCRLLKEMVRIAAQKALPAVTGRGFQINCACVYSDGTQMLTVTGVVGTPEEQEDVKRTLKEWNFANFDWGEPRRIDVPVLSAKERLRLEKHLPVRSKTGKGLGRALGYDIDRDHEMSVRKMRQYGEFYRHYPVFARVEI